MKRAIFTFLAMTFAIAGTLLAMLEHQITLFPDKIAQIASTGCFMFSGMFWMLFGISYRTKSDSEGTTKNVK